MEGTGYEGMWQTMKHYPLEFSFLQFPNEKDKSPKVHNKEPYVPTGSHRGFYFPST